MYQKEVIYMGLYKDGSRMGSAGFLKVENRDYGSRLFLKIQNVPHSINGRFPIRIYNGNDWKEINGVTVQDGKGNWAENLGESVDQTIMQVMLPGGYMLMGKSKYAPETGEQQNPVIRRSEESRGNMDARRSGESQRNMDARQSEESQRNTDARQSKESQRNTDARQSKESRGNTDARQSEESRESVDVQRSDDSQRSIGSDRIEGGQERVGEWHAKNIQGSMDVSRPEDSLVGVGVDGWQYIGRQENVEIPQPAQTQANIPALADINMEMDENEGNEKKNISMRKETGIPLTIDRKRSRQESVPQTIIITEELPRHVPEAAPAMPQNMEEYHIKEDKWEQILDTYEQIHPYGDDRVYVKIEPKDFVILQSKYQHLVNNSFLLHGFYNYRYIILGKEQDYYLGVPGVFYEREKMVALMFGFEAFECPGGNVQAGEFGYYLRKVEL